MKILTSGHLNLPITYTSGAFRFMHDVHNASCLCLHRTHYVHETERTHISRGHIERLTSATLCQKDVLDNIRLATMMTMTFLKCKNRDFDFASRYLRS